MTSHAHMDAGSFVYEYDGVRWSMDLGMQDYHSLESRGIDLWNQGEGGQRWDVFRIGNESHSTLTVNGKHHMVKSFVPLTDVWKEKKRKGARLDMTSVFAGQVADAERDIWLDRKNHLHVEDRISASGRDIEVRWTMMTPAEAEIISEKEIRLEKNGHRMALRFESSGLEALPFVLPDDPPHEYDAPNPGTCRVGFTVTVPAGAEAVLKASLVPVR